jgi:TonB family protein
MGGLVRCVECETEPLTPGHFCDCCGRQLSVAERTNVEANPVSAAPVVEASPRTALRGPCESCGGPSSDGPLCESCQSAFHLVIDGSISALLTPEITHDVEQFAPVTADSPPAPSAPQSASTEAEMLAPAGGESAGALVNTDWSALNAVETDPAEAVASETTVALTASEVARFASIEAPTYEPDAVETEPAHAEARRTTAAVADSATSEAGHADCATGQTVSLEIAPLPEPEFARGETAHVEAAPTEPKPVRVTDSPGVSPQQSTAQWMGLAAAAVIAVAAMGVPLGVWLGTRHQAQPEPQQAAAPGVQKAAVAAAPVPAASAPTKDREVLPPEPQAAAFAQPKAAAPGIPSAKASIRTPAKTARKVVTTPRPIALQPVPVEVVQALAASPVVEPQPVPEPPRIVAPTPPAGRLFDVADVDESPRVATRIEPQLPRDVVERFPKDVVVVRVLVSQTGHPFRVSLLRRSLGGRSLDDAVVAAVSQWTFSPARKRGEAVSCWMNFGVPVGR